MSRSAATPLLLEAGLRGSGRGRGYLRLSVLSLIVLLAAVAAALLQVAVPELGFMAVDSREAAARHLARAKEGGLATWSLVSKGRLAGSSHRLVAKVQQRSFSRFACFSQSEDTPLGGPVWWRGGERLEGPVRLSSTLSVDFRGATRRQPLFTGLVTSSAAMPVSYQPWEPRSEEELRQVFLDGSRGLRTGVAALSFPPSTAGARSAALAGLDPGGLEGVVLPTDAENRPSGGIVVGGPGSLVFSVPLGQTRLTVTQAGGGSPPWTCWPMWASPA